MKTQKVSTVERFCNGKLSQPYFYCAERLRQFLLQDSQHLIYYRETQTVSTERLSTLNFNLL